jgi:hypothetical protein
MGESGHFVSGYQMLLVFNNSKQPVIAKRRICAVRNWYLATIMDGCILLADAGNALVV